MIAVALSLVLNAQPFFIKAVSYDPSYPGKELFDEIPPAVIEADFVQMKQAGFNTIRSYEPLNDTLLDLAEKHGLFVIEAVVRLDDGVDYASDEALAQATRAAVANVARHQKRRGILMWSLWNDAPFHWGTQGGNVVKRFGLATMNKFLGSLAKAVKAQDPSRKVTAANMLNAPGSEVGFAALDVIGLNVYLGIADWASQTFDVALAERTLDRILALQKKHKKPIYISELGQSSFPPTSAQGGVIPTQLALIGDQLAGFCIFQWQDNWAKGGDVHHQAKDNETHWGLLYANREKKPGFDAIVASVQGAPKLVRPASHVHAAELARSPKAVTLEGFDYQDNQALLGAYTIRNKGPAAYRATVDSGALLISFVPENFGAWLYFARPLDVDWQKYRWLRFSMKSEGPPMNVSPFLVNADGTVLRGAGFLTGNSTWKDFRVDLRALFRDVPFEKSLKEKRAGIGIKVNDVANFEQIGLGAAIRIDELVLEP